MNLRLIACNVFFREACACVARSPHVVDIDFLELGEHARPDRLRVLIQERIDAADHAARPPEAVLLLFGLCGNAGAGLVARCAPLVMPRAHDCATVLLGSRTAFHTHFGDNPSQGFSSNGYLDRGDYVMRKPDEGGGFLHGSDAYAELVRQHGEDNARYVWEMLHPAGQHDDRAFFIRVPGIVDAGHVARFRAKVADEGRRTVELTGDLRLIAALVEGRWDPEEFLVVPSGQRTAAVYDWDVIVRAIPA